jgi:hypothetical protein
VSITETQTQTLDIRDAMYNVVTIDPFFTGYTFRKTKMLPVQTDLIPYLGVYIVDEVMVPDGDANAGCIRFNHTSRIGFSVVQANNNPVTLEQGIDAAYLKIMGLLWTNIKLMNVLVNNNPEGVGIESVVRGSRKHVFGSTGLNNETPFAELQYEVQCFTRSEWYPDITDMLNEIDVTTGIKAGDTQTEMDQRQQVTVKYMLDVLRAARRS